MVSGWFCLLFGAVAASLCAQTDVPVFTREGILPVWGKRA